MPEVIDKIQNEVNEINKTLGQHEEIKRFRLVSHEWSPASGELSPTLKLRRNVIAQTYKDIIAEIYSAGKNQKN
jgi:long-chain acyl-CoA synthetase